MFLWGVIVQHVPTEYAGWKGFSSFNLPNKNLRQKWGEPWRTVLFFTWRTGRPVSQALGTVYAADGQLTEAEQSYQQAETTGGNAVQR